MKLRSLALLGAALALLMLVSCQIIIEPPAWPPAGTVNISTSGDDVLQGSHTLARDESVVYRLSNTGGSGGVIYVELNTGDSTSFDLEVINASGQVRYSSISRVVFGSGLSAFGVGAAGDLDQQAIVTSVACRGACVIVPGSEFGSTMYARVTNRGVSTQSVGVYFFRDVYKDSGEPANNSSITAPDLVLGNDYGAIETVGDVDYFWVQSGGILTFDYINTGGNHVSIRADIWDEAGVLIDTLIPGESIPVFEDDLIRVRATDGSFAGVSASSGYRLSYPASLEGANVVPRSPSQ